MIDKQELEQLTKKEINLALGLKYNDKQLKHITKEKLINEYSSQFLSTKGKFIWKDSNRPMAIVYRELEKGHKTVDELKKKIEESGKEITDSLNWRLNNHVTYEIRKKFEEGKVDKLAYKIFDKHGNFYYKLDEEK